ncbi:CpaB family protein [Desulfotruncus alcoholivorax]|uniref:SAF domain-containing protein n=1 Tax=Desulfotruncus alcoholivorax TaxID=265477 RepID=UPI0003FF8652|nr:SAF domain-containing protein [Desulfotruncus alcoholivorax]
MSKKVGIIVSLVLALVFTLLIANTSNKKYVQATQKVEIVQATEFIPIGAELNSSNTKTVEVVKSAAKGLASSKDVAGKTAKIPMVKGQYVYKDALTTGRALRPGYVEVIVPVDLSSSAYAMPGQLVNVHIVDKDNRAAPLVLENIRVFRCLDNQGNDVGSGGNELTKAATRKNEPAAVALEVPKDKAAAVVYAASAKMIYLAKSGI